MTRQPDESAAGILDGFSVTLARDLRREYAALEALPPSATDVDRGRRIAVTGTAARSALAIRTLEDH
ncbi:MAG: hypothetical protein V4466_02280, partial [Pseudomonadota bacterium]